MEPVDQVYQEKREDRLEMIVKNLPQPMKCFKQLQNSNCEIFGMLKEYGGKVAPLAVLACFLNYVGNHILYFL